MLNTTNEEDLLLAVKRSRTQEASNPGRRRCIISKGKHKRTPWVAVKKVVQVYEPEERCQDGALWESFREGAVTTGGSLQWDKCLPITKEASDPPN